MLACVLLIASSTTSVADWVPGDDYKMHWPQTPKAGGLDVEFAGSRLADDWLCTGTGPVSDIHFWVSWFQDMWMPIEIFTVTIWSDWPAGAPGNPYPYSVPREPLWTRDFFVGQFVQLEQPPDLQGWFDPSSGGYDPENHVMWHQINITDIRDPFVQSQDSIYWLELDFWDLPFIGWKETDQNWNDDAVFWYFPDWIELHSPVGESEFIRGDVDGDMQITMNDVMLCMGGPPFLCEDAADVNDDGVWDPSDCDYLNAYIFSGGPPPPPPFPDCGLDPTPDTLTCIDHPCPGGIQPTIDLAFVITTEVELDFGDAPDRPYPTLLANDGARHNIVPGMYLGSSIDSEADGQPAADALGDDNDGSDDEDGVVFLSLVNPGQGVTVKVTASVPGNLDAWVDFNGDGDWADAGEQIFNTLPLATGTNLLTFVVPSSATVGTTYSRFRFSGAGGLSVTGLADDGEVEDYRVFIQEPIEDAKMHWPQWPDLDSTGMDVDMFFAPLADDWYCIESGPVTDIHLWGSFADDIVPLGGPESLVFQLQIRADVPAGVMAEWSMPGEVLWEWFFGPGDYEVHQKADNNPEDWYDPVTQLWLNDNHLQMYQYDFYIDTADAFVQDSGTIYWLSVKDLIRKEDKQDYTFGWKTTRPDLRWNDDAVWFIDPPFFWMEMRYPDGHEYEFQTLDLAFVITGGAECPCGDCNGDGRITIADAIYIASFIYRGGPGMVCNCDVNLDGRLTIADAIYLVAYIYRGGPPPCQPPSGVSY